MLAFPDASAHSLCQASPRLQLSRRRDASESGITGEALDLDLSAKAVAAEGRARPTDRASLTLTAALNGMTSAFMFGAWKCRTSSCLSGLSSRLSQYPCFGS